MKRGATILNSEQTGPVDTQQQSQTLAAFTDQVNPSQSGPGCITESGIHSFETHDEGNADSWA